MKLSVKLAAHVLMSVLLLNHLIGSLSPYVLQPKVREWTDHLDQIFHLGGNFRFFVPDSYWKGAFLRLSCKVFFGSQETYNGDLVGLLGLGAIRDMALLEWINGSSFNIVAPSPEREEKMRSLGRIVLERFPEATNVEITLKSFVAPKVGLEGPLDLVRLNFVSVSKNI